MTTTRWPVKLTLLVFAALNGEAQAQVADPEPGLQARDDFSPATYRTLESIQEAALNAIGVNVRDARISKEQWQEISERLQRQGSLSTETPGSLGEFYERMIAVPQPTRYQSPTDYYVLRNRASDIDSVRQLLDLELDRRPLFGTTFLGRVNAVAVPVANVDTEVVIVVDAGLFTFTWLAAKVVAQATVRQDPEQVNVTFSMDLDQVASNLNRDAKISGRFADLLLAYLRDGSPGRARQYALPAAYMQEALKLTRSFEFFAVGHEYGHILAKHLGAPNQTLAVKQMREFEADVYGFQLSRLAVDRYDEGNLALGLAGPTLYFVIDEIICRGLGVLKHGEIGAYPSTLSHPPPRRRLELLRALVQDKGEQAAPAALAHSVNMEHLIELLWEKSRSVLEAAHSAGLRPARVWRTLAMECGAH
jgi:hypothetical protein